MKGNIFQSMPPHRVGILQSRANRNILEFRENILREYGLSSPEWFVLGCVASEAEGLGVKVGEIATELDVQPTYVTGLLRKLKAKELVYPRTDDQDRRVRIVALTKKGKAVVEAIDKDVIEQSGEWLNQASYTAMQQYMVVLKVLAFKRPQLRT